MKKKLNKTNKENLINGAFNVQIKEYFSNFPSKSFTVSSTVILLKIVVNF